MSTLAVNIPCPTCGTPLTAVTRPEGDYYCPLCPPLENSGHSYRFFKASQVETGRITGSSTLDQVVLESLDCAFVDGCIELGMDLKKFNASTVQILQAVWLKARHNIPPEKKPADMRALLGLQAGINLLCLHNKADLPTEVVHFFMTSDIARADYKAMYENIGG